MNITVLTLFPEVIKKYIKTSIIKKAINKKIVKIKVVDIRKFAIDAYGHVDDSPYGGGAGMLIRADVIIPCIKAYKKKNTKVLLTSPKAKPYTQLKAKELSKQEDFIIICGHYEGFDARIEEYVDEFISLGDFILTGGELVALAIIDSCVRLKDGVINQASLKHESYNDYLLESKQYTRPPCYEGLKVPEVLQNGNHKLIDDFNLKSAISETKKYRPDLYKKYLKNNSKI